MASSFLTKQGKRKLRHNILRLMIGHTIHSELTFKEFERDVAVLYCDLTGVAYQTATVTMCKSKDYLIVTLYNVKGDETEKFALSSSTSNLILKKYASEIIKD